MPKWKPKKVRSDILQNLPHGALTKIAKQNNVSAAHVHNILNGKRNDNYNIVRDAELLAAINIWKDRFCKYPSKL